MASDESVVHYGHRQRMRSKFIAHGARIFDTYELLEMLLYYVVPYKDTNPIAKRLLSEFGSLFGVLSADKESLCRVAGIGERTAELLTLVGSFQLMHNISSASVGAPTFDNYEKTGEYLVRYFNNNKELKIACLLLDNSMRLIAIEDIHAEHFGSAEVRPKMFVDAVSRTGAGVVILVCHHRYGPLCPTESEMQTNKLIRTELSKIGVQVAEFFVVSGRRFIGIGEHAYTGALSASPELERFIDSVKGGECQC